MKSKHKQSAWRGRENPSNLTPRPKDFSTGLSFSTKRSTSGPNVATTIEAINATGVLRAIQDRPGHIAVLPMGGTVQDWHNAGPNSRWTQALRSVVVRVN